MRAALTLCLLTGSLVGSAFPAAAEDVFQRPESCVRVATAQYDDCTVSNQFRCGAEGAVFGREETYGPKGLLDVGTDFPDEQVLRFDSPIEGEDVVVRYVGGDLEEALREGTTNGSSVIELEGWPPEDSMTSDEVYRYFGETVEVAGKRFHRIDVTVTVSLSVTGRLFQTKEVRLYDDESELLVTEKSETKSNSMPDSSLALVTLALPGQPGFASETPIHGCPPTSSRALPHLEVPA